MNNNSTLKKNSWTFDLNTFSRYGNRFDMLFLIVEHVLINYGSFEKKIFCLDRYADSWTRGIRTEFVIWLVNYLEVWARFYHQNKYYNKILFEIIQRNVRFCPLIMTVPLPSEYRDFTVTGRWKTLATLKNEAL